MHFVRYLEANPKELQKLRGRRVLEVGTGTGLVSMVLADVAGCAVVATDLPHVMPNLHACLRANGFAPRAEGGPLTRTGGEGGEVTPAAYSWGDDVSELVRLHGPFDVIIGTDVVYSEYLVPALLRSVATVALASEGRLGVLGVPAGPADRPATKQTLAYLANEIRCTQTQELFCATADRYFRVKQLRRSRYHAESRDTSLHIFELRARTDGRIIVDAALPAPLMELPDDVSFQLCVPFPSEALAGGVPAAAESEVPVSLQAAQPTALRTGDDSSDTLPTSGCASLNDVAAAGVSESGTSLADSGLSPASAVAVSATSTGTTRTRSEADEPQSSRSEARRPSQHTRRTSKAGDSPRGHGDAINPLLMRAAGLDRIQAV